MLPSSSYHHHHHHHHHLHLHLHHHHHHHHLHHHHHHHRHHYRHHRHQKYAMLFLLGPRSSLPVDGSVPGYALGRREDEMVMVCEGAWRMRDDEDEWGCMEDERWWGQRRGEGVNRLFIRKKINSPTVVDFGDVEWRSEYLFYIIE